MKNSSPLALGIAACMLVAATMIAAAPSRHRPTPMSLHTQQGSSPPTTVRIAVAGAPLDRLRRGVVGHPGAQQPVVNAADDPAAGLYAQTCGECHDSVRIVSKRRTKADWQDVITKMIEQGATGSGKDFERVFEYLLRYYGKLYINNAPPDQIALILDLSKKDAEAIAAYRAANGAFPDFEAVKRVPDIDVKSLETHKDAVAF